jgi:hypothetical protein
MARTLRPAVASPTAMLAPRLGSSAAITAPDIVRDHTAAEHKEGDDQGGSHASSYYRLVIGREDFSHFAIGLPEHPSIEKKDHAVPCDDQQWRCHRFEDAVAFKAAFDRPDDAQDDNEDPPVLTHKVKQP